MSLASLPLARVPRPQQAGELALAPELADAVLAGVDAVARAVVPVAQGTAAGHAEQVAELLSARAAPTVYVCAERMVWCVRYVRGSVCY